MIGIFTKILILFVILVIGYIAAKFGWLSREIRTGLSNILLHVATPCVILQSFQEKGGAEIWRSMGISAAVLTLFMLGGLAVCWALLRRESSPKRATLAYGTSFGNVGYMGIPVLGAFVGAEGMIYVSVAIAIFNLLSWTVGVCVYDKNAFRPKKLLTFPCLYAVAIGLVLFAFQIRMPALLDGVTEMIGNTCSPLSMMMIGAILSENSWSEFLKDKKVMISSAVRLLAIPALTLGLCALAHIDGMMRTVLVLLNGMPSAVNTVLLSLSFHGDEALGSRMVALSTLLYLPATLLWMLIL